MDSIEARLFALRDPAYADFQAPLIPGIPREQIIGVRTPALRALAKELRGTAEAEAFLRQLPHRWFDENQLHAFLLEGEPDFTRLISRLEAFLPYVDNWATCDQLSPKAFKKHRSELLPLVENWARSEHTYTARFAVKTLMTHFLDEEFEPRFLETAANAAQEDYYMRMVVAWFFATALAKQWDAAFPWIRDKKLAPWVHNKAIQKAAESFRITKEQKALLRTFRISGSRH